MTGGQGQGQGGADGGADGAHRAIDGLVQLDELLGEGQAGVARLFRRAGLGLGMAVALVKAAGLADVLDLSYLSEADLVRRPSPRCSSCSSRPNKRTDQEKRGESGARPPRRPCPDAARAPAVALTPAGADPGGVVRRDGHRLGEA